MGDNKKLREISLNGCSIIGEGAVGKVYRIDNETIVKVYNPGVPLEVALEEKNIAKAAFVAGVPTAISFDLVKVGDCYGTVYEMLNARTLSDYISEFPDQAEKIGRRMGKQLKELHSIKADTSKFVDMKELYKKRVLKMEKYFTKKEIDKLLTVYDSLENCSNLLHGDYHSKNVMYLNDEFVFIDLADMGYGHPLLDFGSTYLVVVFLGGIFNGGTERFLGLDYDSAVKSWKGMIKEYFGEENIEQAEALAKIYGCAKLAIFPVIMQGMSEKDRDMFIGLSRKNGILNDEFDISLIKNHSLRFPVEV